jgi:hypothetical protein
VLRPVSCSALLGGAWLQIGNDLDMAEKLIVALLSVTVLGCVSQTRPTSEDEKYCEAARAKKPGMPSIEAIALEIETRDWSFDDQLAPEEAFTEEALDRVGHDWGELGALCRCLVEEGADEPATCRAYRDYLDSFT